MYRTGLDDTMAVNSWMIPLLLQWMILWLLQLDDTVVVTVR
jgi:hypothetical protein